MARAHPLLLVDDGPNTLNALSRVLRHEDWRILSTTSARDAFEFLAVHQIGVIVYVERMPEMSGVEFLDGAIGRDERGKG